MNIDFSYQVFNASGQAVMHAPESCRYPRRIELDIMKAGYVIRLHGKKLTKSAICKEEKSVMEL